MLGIGLREHGHEIIIGAIMVGVSIALAFGITGDFGDALAKSRRQ